MNVLSLFDGMGCCRIALERAGIQVDNYFASEIDKHAIKVSQDNWDDVTAIGDVTKVSFKGGVLYTEVGEFNIGKIDLVAGGSPCQSFSFAGKQEGFEGKSGLFYHFKRILDEVREHNPDVKFLLENVRMKKIFENVLVKELGVSPITINSNLVSAQNRVRLYWTNIDSVYQPEDRHVTLEDIIVADPAPKYFIKSNTNSWMGNYGNVDDSTEYKMLFPHEKFNFPVVLERPHGWSGGFYSTGKMRTLLISSSSLYFLQFPNGVVRKFTPEEFEMLQTVPVGYTKCVSNAQRYKMLGNGWTVDVIAHIFKNL